MFFKKPATVDVPNKVCYTDTTVLTTVLSCRMLDLPLLSILLYGCFCERDTKTVQ